MNEHSTSKVNTLLSAILAIATAVLSYFSFGGKLNSSRPVDPHLGVKASVGKQDVTARLWEDPLQAVRADLQSHAFSETEHKPASLRETIQTSYASNRPVNVLAVMLDGNGFAEDIEVRLRLRYAVQMALAEQGWLPQDRSHLGFVQVPWPSAEDNGAQPAPPTRKYHVQTAIAPRLLGTNQIDVDLTLQGDSPSGLKELTIPYEWFVPDKSSPGNAKLTANTLVLWLNEEGFADYPLSRLRGLLNILSLDDTNRLARTFLVGPRSSDTLKQMYGDAGKLRDKLTFNGAAPALPPLRAGQLKIFSPEATAPDFLITGGTVSGTNDPIRSNFSARLADQKWLYSNPTNIFSNWIQSDEQLAELLVSELELRNVALRPATAAAHSRPHWPFRKTSDPEYDEVALIAESDTTYGRALPLAFSAAALCQTGTESIDESLRSLVEGDRAAPSHVKIYRYLRGLDGKTGHDGGNKHEEKHASARPEEALDAALTNAAEIAEGEAQLDYAERLAKKLADFDHESRRQFGRPLKAIGVLGSDVYDKLILLQALHQKLPDVIFFTTDLDARLWHPQQYSFTRNLVIASAWGVDPELTAPNALDFKLPPFRDSYQTAVFQACRAALVEAGTTNGPVLMPPSAGIYEVGRSGPFLLRSPLESARYYQTFRINNKRSVASVWAGFLMMLLGVVGVAASLDDSRRFMRNCWQGLLGWKVFPPKPSQTEPNDGQVPDTGSELVAWRDTVIGVTLSGLFLALMICGYCFFQNSHNPGGEPWAWKEGVSVWPTELVRLLIVGLAIACLAEAWYVYHCHRRILWNHYFFHSDRQVDTPSAKSLSKELEAVFHEMPKAFEAAQKSSKSQFERFRNRVRYHCGFVIMPDALGKNGRVNARRLFHGYLANSHVKHRLFRVFLFVLVYMLVGFGLMNFSGEKPFLGFIRGPLAQAVDKWFLGLLIFASSVLLFYMVDAVIRAGSMAEKLARGQTDWDEPVLARHEKRWRLDHRHLSWLLDVKFTAIKTEEPARLLVYPVLILILMLLSRNNYFDDWTWPGALLAIFVLNVVILIGCIFYVRKAAREVRKTALNQLEEETVQLQNELSLQKSESEIEAPGSSQVPGATSTHPPAKNKERTNKSPYPKDTHYLERLNRLILEIKEEKGGAYAALWQDPGVAAVLIPTGGLGVIIVAARYLFGN
ncbi:MAG TPA: hypothetical protein VMB21_11720 [Candidatus Limnocylindria bacterium]|nr:hypothetical protein [Candidatus Limnocylindria bacterium]